ncbi:hypothetical protein HYX08_07260 [Candidatus Woesearchaeota archaeon]|nr:hypothetical protein [Candidatus Woesearchaeota archaeon]
MKISNGQKEIAAFSSIILLACLIFSFVLFGIAGVRVVFGIVLVSLPFYLILNNFEFNESEKFVFSILLGLTVFPLLAYLLGFITSFKWAIAITFVLLMAAAFMPKMKKLIISYGKV